MYCIHAGVLLICTIHTKSVFREFNSYKNSVRLKSSFDLYLTVQILKYSENFSTPIKH